MINHHFVQQALQPLVAMLLSELTKQEEGQDEDDGAWNLSMAGGTCLGLVASVVGDDILAIIMPYVQVPAGCPPPGLLWGAPCGSGTGAVRSERGRCSTQACTLADTTW